MEDRSEAVVRASQEDSIRQKFYANEAPKKGRSRRGKPIFRTRSRYAKKYTLHKHAKKKQTKTQIQTRLNELQGKQ